VNARPTTSSLTRISPALAAWRATPGVQEAFLWVATIVLGVAGGASLVVEPRLAKLLAVAAVALPMLMFRPERVFVAWLFATPFVQGAASGGHSGHVFYKFIFLAPPLILLARMATGSVRNGRLWTVDVVPAMYFVYILVSARLFRSEFTPTAASTLRSVYIAVGIGVLAYYFAAFGSTSASFPESVARSFLWSGVLVAVLGVIDGASGWNLWHNVVENVGVHRAVSTFESPEAMGAWLGAGVAFAVAILVWSGPRSLRLPAILLIVTALPALYLSYTRGAVVATAAVVVLLALIRNRARWPSLLVLAAVGIVLFASWGNISSSSIYKSRLGVTGTVTPRVVLAHVAVELFKERPVFGWGYATFDQAKLTVQTRDPLIVETTTSHDTFLTVLAELGGFGLTLLVLPWVVIGWRAVVAGWRGSAQPWVVAGCVGAAATFVIGAITYDARFFPLITAVPWITMGLVRRQASQGSRDVVGLRPEQRRLAVVGRDRSA
jgi:O-antigen ligase